MNDKFQLAKFFESLVPYIIAGIAISLFLGLLVVFSYAVVWGVLIGGVLWLAASVKRFLFPSKTDKTELIKKNEGRIIEHDDEQ